MSRVILLADDSVTIQKVIELTFMDEDYQVVAVSNGDEAVAKLQEIEPDIVISDVHMPGASGYDVCRHSKQQHPGVPVLLLVGTFEPFEESEAEAAGAESFLKKPFDSQELLRRVEELLAGSAGAPPAAAAAAPEPPAVEQPAAPFEEEPAEPVTEALGEEEEVGEEEELEAWDQVKIAEEEPEPEPVWSNFDAGVAAEVAEEEEGERPTRGEERPWAGEEELPSFGEEPFPSAGMEALPSEPEAAPPPSGESEAPGPVAWEPLEAEEAPEAKAALEAEAGPSEAAPGAAAAELSAPPPLAVPEPPAPAEEGAPAEAAAAEPAEEALPAVEGLSDQDVDRIARRVAEVIGEKAIRDIAWEVIPDLAEIIIRNRLRELEGQLESQADS